MMTYKTKSEPFKNHKIVLISCFLREGIEILEQRISAETINETNCN